MDMQELERKLEQAQKEVSKLQAEVRAKAELPLEHGDWWLSKSGRVKIFMKEYNSPYQDCVALNDYIITNIGSTYQGEPIKGNIFKDLKALSKPIKDFEVFGVEVKLEDNGSLLIGGQGIPQPWVQEFFLGLRRMEAGLK